MAIEWSLTIIAFSFLIMTVFAVLFFWQARRTAKAVEASLETLNSRLPEFLSKLEEILSSLLISSQSIRTQVESLALALSRTRNLFDYVFNYEKVILDHLAGPLLKLLNNAGAIKKGLSAFFTALSNPVKNSR
jgi:ABC-type multidrug transport system fused ATPase/permease subunit